MALRPLSELLAGARDGGYAVGYFEAWDSYSLEAVADAAALERAPVVLGFGGLMMHQEWFDRYGIEPLGALGRSVAERLSVPAALILNEARDLRHALRGLDAGYNVVVLASGELPYPEHRALTRELVAAAHARGVEVQAELGCLPTFGDDHASTLTDPDQAAEFVAGTGIDFLAVSIGNEHLRTQGTSAVDPARLRAIRERVDVPLVVHGGSGLADADVRALIDAGAALFHVGTILKRRWLEAVREAVAALPAAPDWQAVVGSRGPGDVALAGQQAVTDVVRRRMSLYGSSGRE